MELNEKKIEKLDGELMQLALERFDFFCSIAGIDKVQAFVCIERTKGRSYGEIAVDLNTTRSNVYKKCKKCG